MYLLECAIVGFWAINASVFYYVGGRIRIWKPTGKDKETPREIERNDWKLLEIRYQ